MRSHAVRGLGHPRGDELRVALAAAFRLAVGQVPLAVMQRGWPSGMRIMLRAGTVPGLEQDAGNLIAGGVHDDVGPVPVGQQHHVGRRRAAASATSSRCGSGPTRTELTPAPDGSHQASRTSPCAAITTRERPAAAAPAPRSSALAVSGWAPRRAASRAASAQATSHASDRLTGASGTATVAVTARSDPAGSGSSPRSAGLSDRRPSRWSGCVLFGLAGMLIPARPAGRGATRVR